MTQDEIQTEINSLKNILAQRDNDALEAIDELVVAVSECKSLISLTQAIFDCMKAFHDAAKNRIQLRAELRELIAQLEPED